MKQLQSSCVADSSPQHIISISRVLLIQKKLHSCLKQFSMTFISQVHNVPFPRIGAMTHY